MSNALHLIAILLSLCLMVQISADVLSGADPLGSRGLYLMICALLLADFVALWLLAVDPRTFWLRHWPLLVVSLPLSWGAELMLADAHPGLYHAMRFLPLVRGGVAMYILAGWWVRSVRGRMLLTYLVISAGVVYFSSLLFYCFERGVNPAVGDYADAIWWAAMNFTTIGSNIVAATVVGKVLGVVMGFCGMMMLPVFTAFFVGATASKSP